jgi:hypothetical protein
MLSRRFDPDDATRVPFLSAMAMMGARDGERGSYPEIVDALAQHGARAVGARSAEITRMSGAFEHDDIERALAL